MFRPKRKESTAIMQSHSEIEGRKFVTSFGRVVLPSSVGGTVEWSCQTPGGIAPEVEEVRAKEMKMQVVEKFLLRWALRLGKR